MIKKWDDFQSVDLRKNYIGLSTDNIWSIFLDIKEMSPSVEISLEYGNHIYNERTKTHDYSNSEISSVWNRRKCIKISFLFLVSEFDEIESMFNSHIDSSISRLEMMGYNVVRYSDRLYTFGPYHGINRRIKRGIDFLIIPKRDY